MDLECPRLSRKVLALHDIATSPSDGGDREAVLVPKSVSAGGARPKDSRPHSRAQSAPQLQQKNEWNKFLNRQKSNEGLVRRCFHAQAHRACIERESLKRAGSTHGRHASCNFLRRQYGTVLAGWRTMDVHQKGYLCYAEFCQSCREMLFNGDIRSLWRELDANEKGIVTLKEVCPEVALHVCGLKKVMLKLHGSMMKGWWRTLDRQRKGFVSEAEFVAGIRRLQMKDPEYKTEPRELFRMFVAPGANKLSLAEFDPTTWTKVCCGELRREKLPNPET